MFTGIVTDIGEVQRGRARADGLRRFVIACGYDRASIAIGASIACSGICLTVVETGLKGGRTWFAVDAAAETVGLTNVRQLAARHAHQSRALAEDRRRTGRPYRHRPCRRSCAG